MPVVVCAQQDDLSAILSDDPVVPISDAAKFLVDGREVQVEEEITVPRQENLLFHVELLKPGSWVKITVRKTGMKVETASYKANEKGEIVLEVKTPHKKVGATLDVDYTASSGKQVGFRCRVVFR